MALLFDYEYLKELRKEYQGQREKYIIFAIPSYPVCCRYCFINGINAQLSSVK